MSVRSAVSVRARLAVIGAVAVCSVALAGCQAGDTTGTPENTATTTAATPSTTPTQTPTPTPSGVYKPADASGKAQNVPVPVKPPLADQNSKKGLEAFTKYWFELLSYGFETGDISVWSTLSSTTSTYCNNLRETVTANYAANGWQVGGHLHMPSISATLTTESAGPQIVVQVLQDAAQFHTADGSAGREPDPASNNAVVVLASFADGQWSVTDMHPVV